MIQYPSTAGLFQLGSSPLSLRWSADFEKAAKDTSFFERQSPLFEKKWEALCARFQSGEVGFFHAPLQPDISQWEASEKLAQGYLKENRWTDCLFIGIGGSALGPFSLLEALGHTSQKSAQALHFHFLENPDPLDWELKTQSLRPESTLICVVTKSGTTFETLALALLAFDWVHHSKDHLIFLTDPSQGDLLQLAKDEGIRTLVIHPSIGGRFSLFSPVGLFPAALAGLSPKAFLQGAQEVKQWIEQTPVPHHLLFWLSHFLIHQFPTHPIHVCMPYSTRLRAFGDWFVQLWAESLGKKRLGFTPLAALGATDQHSILQLLRDGPQNKVTFFIQVGQFHSEGALPVLPWKKRTYPSFEHLQGHSLASLLKIEQQAVEKVLEGQQHPFLVWSLEQLDERNLGALTFLFCSWVAILGALWDIDPFDQPGVEEGKGYIRKALFELQIDRKNKIADL